MLPFLYSDPSQSPPKYALLLKAFPLAPPERVFSLVERASRTGDPAAVCGFSVPASPGDDARRINPFAGGLCTALMPVRNPKRRGDIRNLSLILATTIGFVLSAGAVSAQTAMDADGNGTYSYDELVAAFPDMTEETFLTVDANADGTVDDSELAMAQDAGLVPADD